MEQEIWKDVEGYDGDYLVSNFGKVESLRFNKRILLKPCKNSSGYYTVCLSKNKIRKIITVHRLVAEAFIKNPNNLPQIDHLDGNGLNNFVENFFCANDARAKKILFVIDKYFIPFFVKLSEVIYLFLCFFVFVCNIFLIQLVAISIKKI